MKTDRLHKPKAQLKFTIFFVSINVLLPCWICQQSLCQDSDYSLVRSEYSIFEPVYRPNGLEGCHYCIEKFLFGIRIDSSIIGEDNVTYFFNREIVKYPYECYKIGPSIIGDSVIEESNGISRCFTLDSNEFIIDRSLSYGDSNRLFSFDNGDYISAKVTSHELESFLNISDSVKTFSMNLYDSSNNTIESAYNKLHLKISKNYGLIHFFSFRDFPEPEYYHFTSLDLIGTSTIEALSFKYTYGDIYDFDIGDEFHYHNYIGKLYTDYEDVIRTVITKRYSTTNDSLFYTYNDKIWGQKLVPHGEGYRYEYYQNEKTYEVSYTNLNEYVLIPDTMPYEGRVEDWGLLNSLMFRLPDNLYNRFVIRNIGQVLGGNENCAHPPLDSWNEYYTEYINGCGHLINHYTAEISDEFCWPCENLVYYKKGNETWGEPLTVGIQNYYGLLNDIDFYPNPASSKITIDKNTTEYFELHIYDILGNIIIQKQNPGEVQIYNLDPGTYVLLFILKDTTIPKKLVIRR